MKKKSIYILAGICLLFCVFGMSVILYEPNHCAICEAAESDVPCLIDLHSGEIAELWVSDGEQFYDPSASTFSFINVLGTIGYRDTGEKTCKVTLPQDNLYLFPYRFCRDCSKKLQDVGKCHYAVLDTTSKIPYPIVESSFAIGNYSITITKEANGMCITVQSRESEEISR